MTANHQRCIDSALDSHVERLASLIVMPIRLGRLRRFEWSRLLLCIPLTSFSLRTRSILRRRIWWSRIVIVRRSISWSCVVIWTRRVRRRLLWTRSVVNAVVQGSAVTAFVARPVPPRQAVVISVAIASTAFCSSFPPLLVAVMA